MLLCKFRVLKNVQVHLLLKEIIVDKPASSYSPFQAQNMC